MNMTQLDLAIAEAERFLAKAKTLKDKATLYLFGRGDEFSSESHIHTAAVKRASMDLTRALAELRRPTSGA